jgi:hypothetical protein
MQMSELLSKVKSIGDHPPKSGDAPKSS